MYRLYNLFLHVVVVVWFKILLSSVQNFGRGRVRPGYQSLNPPSKLLGVHLDNNLNFSKHVNSVSESCHFHLRALRHIRSTLDLDAAKLIGHALISLRLDYCNSILYSAPELSISKLQRIQNALARVVLHTNSATSAGPLLNTNHYIHNPRAILLPCSTIICQLEISVHPIHCFFLPTQQKQILACMLFNLPHQTSGTNCQLMFKSACSILSFKAHLKTDYFQHTS